MPLINTGDSIQAAVDANPTSTAFCLASGLHEFGSGKPNPTSVIPKSGNTFTGQFGAILDGTAWSFSDVDDAMFKGVNNEVVNVTVQNLLMRNGPSYAVNSYLSAENWTVYRCEIHHFVTGISVGTGGIISHNFIHHNVGDSESSNPALRGGGLSQNSAEGTQIIYNEVSYNGFEQKCGAFGSDRVNRDVYVAHNFFHHNLGNGIWIDTYGDGTIIENNLIEDNGGVGIDIEQTTGVIVRNNTVRRHANGEGIYVTVTRDSMVTGNVCEDNLYGIGLRLDYASLYPASELFPWNQDLTNNTISGNTISVFDGQHASWLTVVGGDTTPYDSNARNNQFVDNIYIVPNPVAAYWRWVSANKTFAQWQAVPQDTGGSMSLR